MSAGQTLWLGYGHDGERATLDVGSPGSRLLLLGSKAASLAALAAVSAKDAGLSPVIFDLEGSLANSLSGYFDTFDYRSFLYDSFRLEEPEAWHSQLAAAAYTLALNLSSEEEAIINAAMQAVASDGTLLSPVSLHDVMGKVEGFRGFYVDKLSGRIGSLKLFDAADDQSFERLTRGNVLVDFHRAPYPQAAELSAALFVAKILATSRSKSAPARFLLISGAHRIFRSTPRPSHMNRLLGHLVSWEGAVALASDQQSSLDPQLLQSCPLAMYSSDAWHASVRMTGRVLPGSFVLHDGRSERTQSFVPRRIPSRTSDYVPARAGKYQSPDLVGLILTEVDRYPFTTHDSLEQYLAPDFLQSDVSAALDLLERQGCLIVEPKDPGSGPKVFAYTLSEKGRKALGELRR